MSRRPAAALLVVLLAVSGCSGAGQAAAPGPEESTSAVPTLSPTPSPTPEPTFRDIVQGMYGQAKMAIEASADPTDPVNTAQALGAFVSAVGVLKVEPEREFDLQAIVESAQAAARAYEVAASATGVARAAAVLEAARVKEQLEALVAALPPD